MEGEGTEQLRFVRKQIGEPLCPIDSIDRRVDRSDWGFLRLVRSDEGGSRCREGAGEAS